MKITEDVRKYAAEQGIAEEEALKKGMEEKSKEFVERARRFTRRRELHVHFLSHTHGKQSSVRLKENGEVR
jgi:phosphomethylpyrimidine synthase